MVTSEFHVYPSRIGSIVTGYLPGEDSGFSFWGGGGGGGGAGIQGPLNPTVNLAYKVKSVGTEEIAST